MVFLGLICVDFCFIVRGLFVKRLGLLGNQFAEESGYCRGVSNGYFGINLHQLSLHCRGVICEEVGIIWN